jgi:hypothetical protein
LTKPAKTGKEDTMMMVKRLAGVALGALLAVNAFAFFGETEPNNTRATPDVLVFDAANGYTAPWSDVGVLSLTANDSDFFKIWLNELDWLTAITFPIQTNYTQPDTVMALFDGTGTTAIVYNDDAGVRLRLSHSLASDRLGLLLHRDYGISRWWSKLAELL